MELKTYFAQDRAGNVIPNANIAIYFTGTTTLATGLKTASDDDLANPFNADANGRIQFKAPDGMYDMQISYGSQTGPKITISVLDYQESIDELNSIHENLVPLGKQYTTLAEAQADIANIPVGAYVYVHSSSGRTLADEYQNIAGVLTATGSHMPSQAAVDDALSATGQISTAASVRESALNGVSMPERRAMLADYTQLLATYSAGGSAALNGSGTFSDRVMMAISSLSTPFSTGACRVVITGAGKTLFDKGILGGETLTDGALTTPYFDVSMRSANITSVAGNLGVGTWVLTGTIKLPKAFDASEGRVLRDRKNRINIAITSTIYAQTTDSLAFDAATGTLRLAVSVNKMTAAGYENSESGAQAYFWDTYGGIILSQKSTTTQTLPEFTLFVSEPGAISVTTDQACTATVNVYKATGINSGLSVTQRLSAQVEDDRQQRAKLDLREVISDAEEYQTHIGAIGSNNSIVAFSSNFKGDSIFKMDSLSLGTSVRDATITLTDSAGEAKKFTLLEGESVLGTVLTSPYVDFSFIPKGFYNVGTNGTRFLLSVPVNLPGSLPVDATRIIRDRKAVYSAFTPSTIGNATTPGVTYDSATGYLILAVLNADIVAAGYEATTFGAIQYVIDKLSGYRFSQVTSTSSTSVFCNLFRAAPGSVSLSSNAAVTLNGNFYGQKMTSEDLTTYRRYESKVSNNTDYAINSKPIRIKCKFAAGEVPNDKCLVVIGPDGSTLPCQWAGELDFNPRRGRDLSYWADGSLRSGDLLVIDSIPANSSKIYKIKAYPTEQVVTSYSRVKRETPTSLLVTADDGTETRFDSSVGWLPFKLTRNGVTYTTICQQLYATVTGTAWATVAAGYTNYAYKVLSDGPLFTEIETTFFNGALTGNVAIPAGQLKHIYRTKVFKNGYVLIDASARLVTDLAANALFACMTRIQLNSTATKSVRNEYNSIWTDASVGRSISLRYAGGDAIRDSAESATLGNRTPVAGLTTTTTYSRFDGGWTAGTYGASTTTLGAPANWAWTLGFSINLAETAADNVALSNIELNPPVGFASRESVYPRIRQAKLAARLGDTISGIAAWNALDATATDNNNGMFNTIAGDIVRYLHLNIGTFSSVYAKFSAWATTWYGGISNIHLGSSDNSKSLQFASRLVLPQLWWLYKLAVLNADTAKQNELKTAINNMAADCYSAFGPSATGVNSNFYAAAFRSWAMAVATGTDPAGNYTAMMATIDAKFSSAANFAGVKNIITDNETENVPKRRYLHYQVYAWNNYIIGCKTASRASVLNMKTYALNSISGYGGIKEVDYCIAESRRGQPSTVAFMLYPLLHSGDNSCLEAMERLLDAFDEYGGSNTSGQIKLWDLDFLSVISTNFSDYTFACNVMADTWLQWWFDNNS